jgi:hypothetical protein
MTRRCSEACTPCQQGTFPPPPGSAFISVNSVEVPSWHLVQQRGLSSPQHPLLRWLPGWQCVKHLCAVPSAPLLPWGHACASPSFPPWLPRAYTLRHSLHSVRILGLLCWRGG